MRGSMDSSMDEYHTANEDSFIATSPSLSTTATLASRKQMTPTDPNEPAKPHSAYALFFRDTVSAIKQENPNCAFPELSRIVASMWEALDPSHKNVYNKKNEIAKNEYIKQMRIYRQQQLEQQQQLEHSAITYQSKPAVFTIARTNSADNGSGNGSNLTNQTTNNMQQQTQFQQQQLAVQNQDTYNNQPENVQSQEPSQLNHSHPIANSSIDSPMPSPPSQQNQLITEAGSVQKCIRDNCTKRAIINPDWEDEYCSNECVVIHCRNVFNDWVQSNFDARAG